MKQLLLAKHRKMLLALLLALCFSNSWGQLSITVANVAQTQNFDSLPNSGTGITPSGGIFGAGWSFLEGGSNANTTYDTGTGSGNTGNTYSFGVAGTNAVTDRAFGMLQSGNLTSILGFKFTNNTGSTITSLVIGYTGELWRLSTANDGLAFSYQSGSVALNASSGWTTVSGLAFTTPATGTAAASDGNLSTRRTVISPVTITGLNIPTGTTYTLRWVDGSGSSSAGMAIDDFTITLVPPTPTVTTDAATAIGLDGATLNGTINPNGLTVDASFEYGLTPTYGDTVSSTAGLTGTSDVAVSGTVLSGLSLNTQYNFRAVGTVGVTPNNGSNLTFYTLAATPGAPVVNNPTISTVDVTIDTNSNPANTTYAIHETGGSYVQAGGNLGVSAVYQTASAWGTKTVTGLNDNTTYTFEVKARNGDNVDTAFGATGSETTLINLSAEITVTDTVNDFGNVCTNATAKNTLTFDGANLDGSDVVLGAVTGYTYSLTENGTYTNTLNISYGGTGFTGQTVWVQFSPSAVQSYNGNIQFTGGGLTPAFPTTALSGSGINTAVSATTGSAGSTTATSSVLAGSFTAGCTAITSYGIAYDTANGFATGTEAASTNQASGSFTATATGLEPNTLYYFKAYAVDGTGKHYGLQSSFTTNGLGTPVATAASDVSANAFTANWDALDGADGYRLDVSTSATFGTTQYMSDLIISEYVEGSSNNKAIEIYNGTGASVNLANYSLRKQTNGAGSFGTDTPLVGTLAHGATYVVSNASANSTIQAVTDLSTNASSGVITYNGNDAVALYKSGVQIDVVGVVNQVANWGADVTLVRKPTVLGPTVSYSINDWNSLATDTFSNLGSHTYNSFIPSFVPNFENVTVNGTSYVVSSVDIQPSTAYHYRVRGVSDNSTSPNSNKIDVQTLDAPATFGSIAQVVGVVCDGGEATFNVNGLLPNVTSQLSYNIDNGTTQTVDVNGNAVGFGQFVLTLSAAQNGLVLTVTAVDRNDFPGSPTTVTTDNTVALSVAPNMTYYADADSDGFGDAAVTALACNGAPAGYVANDDDCNDGQVLYTDADGDGFGSDTFAACTGVANHDDCDDNTVRYADNDNDGYGSLVKVACGGSTNNTDCDDTKPTVHPGAVEIGYNLIDDDCDGQIDEGFPPKVTEITGVQCNTALAAIDSQLYADIVAGAQGYQWRITTMSGPNTGQVQYLGTTLRVMKLTQLASYAYDTQYKVEVAVYYAGYLQPYTASNCTVTTPAITTSLISCGQTLSTMSDVIYANNVLAAAGYRFRITDGTSTQTIDRSVREFRMSLITAFQVKFNKTYSVEVAVKNTDGTYLPYGAPCLVNTPVFPTTSVQDSQCEDYAAAAMNTQIYANSYPGAIAYGFNLSGNNFGAEGVEVIKTTRAFRLGDFTGLLPGATYSVRVRLIFNYGDPAGSYGKTCTVTVPGAARMAKLPFGAKAYPNPFADSFSIDVTTSLHETIAVKVYDMTGRLLESKTAASQEMETLTIGDRFPSGVYNVVVSQGDEVKTLRVVKR